MGSNSYNLEGKWEKSGPQILVLTEIDGFSAQCFKVLTKFSGEEIVKFSKLSRDK